MRSLVCSTNRCMLGEHASWSKMLARLVRTQHHVAIGEFGTAHCHSGVLLIGALASSRARALQNGSIASHLHGAVELGARLPPLSARDPDEPTLQQTLRLHGQEFARSRSMSRIAVRIVLLRTRRRPTHRVRTRRDRRMRTRRARRSRRSRCASPSRGHGGRGRARPEGAVHPRQGQRP